MTGIPIAAPRALDPRELVTVATVSITGVLAASYVSPVFYATTLAVAWLLIRAARSSDPVRPSASPEFAQFPPSASDAIRIALDALANGDARRLLLSVIAQARPIFAVHESLLDANAERATCDNAAALVEACCATALELSCLDEVSKTAARASSSPNGGPCAVRAALVDRLSRASEAFNSLYMSGFEHGSLASNRVAELVGELEQDARGRAAAKSQLGDLL